MNIFKKISAFFSILLVLFFIYVVWGVFSNYFYYNNVGNKISESTAIEYFGNDYYNFLEQQDIRFEQASQFSWDILFFAILGILLFSFITIKLINK